MSMQEPLSFQPQPYLALRDFSAQVSFRSGYLLDTATAEYALHQSSAKRTRSGALREPPHLRCPLCNEAINSEHDERAVACRQHNVTIHRMMQCPAMASVSTWYHDVAVRVQPTPSMAALLARVRALKTMSTPQDHQVRDSFLAHLRSPTSACDPSNPSGQHRRMLEATALFLSNTDATADCLPPAQSFGKLPVITLRDGQPALRTTSRQVDDAFWANVIETVPFVPSPCCAPRHEAEAPGGARRNPSRQ